MPKNNNIDHSLYLLIIGMLAWLIPGAGHLAIKETKRAGVIFVTIMGLFLTGLWIGSIGYGFAVLPIAGAAVAAMTFAGLTWLVHNYVLWSLEREADRMPLARWEKAVLMLLAVATVVMLIVVVVLTAAVGWSLAQVKELIGE